MILVVDTSRSMQAKDVEPTRLGAAQEALRNFIDQAPDDLRIGLVVFAGEAQVATPPTDDHELVEAAITDIDEFLVFGGTAIGDALQTAVLLGRQVTDLVPEEGSTAAPAPSDSTRSLAQATEPEDEESEEQKSPVSILFLSDGAQTRGLLQPLEGRSACEGRELPRLHHRARDARRRDRARAVRRVPGQDSGELIPVPPDPATLRAIAETTGGEFSEARDAEALEKAYANLGSRLGREPGESEITWVFLAIGGVLLLLAAGVATVVSPRFA